MSVRKMNIKKNGVNEVTGNPHVLFHSECYYKQSRHPIALIMKRISPRKIDGD